MERGKVIHLPQQKTLIEQLEHILEMAKRGEIEDYVFCAVSREGELISGWRADFTTRQVLISTLQVDLVYGVVQANLGGE